MDRIKARIAKKLKAIIKDMTIIETSRKAQVAPGAIRNILQGKNYEINTIIKICDGLHYDFYDLMSEKESA